MFCETSANLKINKSSQAKPKTKSSTPSRRMFRLTSNLKGTTEWAKSSCSA